MKNLKAPIFKVSPWSQGKWNDSGEENEGEVVMWHRAGGPVGALISHSAALRLCGITMLSSACSYLIATGEAAGQQRSTHSKELRC